ncbi:MAG: hypothetical protein V1822_00500 [Candidatus Micrarchaeota archaeon]
MGWKAFEKWARKFVVSTVAIFVLLEVFEYAIFREILYFSSSIAGMRLPTAVIYSVFLGIAVATAQYVINPGAQDYSEAVAARPIQKAAAKNARRKKKAKRKKR